MKNVVINEVGYEVRNVAGPCCGAGVVVGFVKANLDGEEKTIYCAEVDGMPNVFMADVDLMDYLLMGDEDSVDDADSVNDNYYLVELAGLPVNDYEEFYSSLEDAEDTPAAQLIRLLFYMTRCSEEDAEEMAKTVAGKDVMEIEIPMTDIEEEMVEE